MSNTAYNVQQYVRFSADEFLALTITSFCVALALSLRDLLFVRFLEVESYLSFALMFIFVLFIILVCVYLCKIVGIKFGHVIRYRAHLPGLGVGLAITLMSAGWLPVFLPGGFLFEQPERLAVGKFLGYRRGWELGFVAGTFPLAALLFLVVLSPLYLASQASLYLQLMLACSLLAFYSCIPLPFFTSENGGRLRDWFAHMHGNTFGLEVVFASKAWYLTLLFTVVLFSLLAYVLTLLGVGAGIFVYILTLLLAAFIFWVYPQFFKVQKK